MIEVIQLKKKDKIVMTQTNNDHYPHEYYEKVLKEMKKFKKENKKGCNSVLILTPPWKMTILRKED